MPEPRGRPKTAGGYRDDAMLTMLEFDGLVREQRQLMQVNQRAIVAKLNEVDALRIEHYRAERAGLERMVALLNDAARSWRYGELADQLAAGRVAEEDSAAAIELKATR